MQLLNDSSNKTQQEHMKKMPEDVPGFRYHTTIPASAYRHEKGTMLLHSEEEVAAELAQTHKLEKGDVLCRYTRDAQNVPIDIHVYYRVKKQPGGPTPQGT